MPKTVGVAVSNATFHFDKLYTYAVMPDQQNAVKLGSMVLVPFGRGSRARMGVVLAAGEEPAGAKLKELYDRGVANGVSGMELLTGEQARALEPNLSEEVEGALLAHTSGIVCPFELTLGLAESAGNLDLDESDPEHWIDRGGSANVLTPAVRSNYMPGLSGYNNGIVNIEKYEGEPVPPDCERDIFQIEEQ